MILTGRIPLSIKRKYFYKKLVSLYTIIKGVYGRYGYIRNYFLFPISAFFRCRKIVFFYKPYKVLDDMRNKYKGKRCFIIAPGPSLMQDDVEKLDNEITIGLNRFYRMYINTSFRPTYYMSLDPTVLRILQNEEFNYAVNDFAKEFSIFNDVCRNDLRDVKDKICFLPTNWQNHWVRASDPLYDYKRNLKYSDNLLWGIYDKYTVTCAAIEFAVHLGCTEIFLLGVDCNYMGKKKQFMETEADLNASNEQFERQAKLHKAAYAFMEKETSKRHVKVFNATRGGNLEEFERVNFDTLF